ncbi:MAG: hypothetical protein NTW72_03075 [Gemmatimonadetes bacterium]|nr:hypothetical protein [Gemmatimonadota bacterium]
MRADNRDACLTGDRRIAAGGVSAQATARQKLPPMVARLRICALPMARAASASAAKWVRTSGEAATSATVVNAPMRSAPSAAVMPRSSPR